MAAFTIGAGVVGGVWTSYAWRARMGGPVSVSIAPGFIALASGAAVDAVIVTVRNPRRDSGPSYRAQFLLMGLQ